MFALSRPASFQMQVTEEELSNRGQAAMRERASCSLDRTNCPLNA
jgi:hypothetical protein